MIQLPVILLGGKVSWAFQHHLCDTGGRLSGARSQQAIIDWWITPAEQHQSYFIERLFNNMTTLYIGNRKTLLRRQKNHANRQVIEVSRRNMPRQQVLIKEIFRNLRK